MIIKSKEEIQAELQKLNSTEVGKALGLKPASIRRDRNSAKLSPIKVALYSLYLYLEELNNAPVLQTNEIKRLCKEGAVIDSKGQCRACGFDE